MIREVLRRTCRGWERYLLLNGALVRLEDVRSLPREWRLRIACMGMGRGNVPSRYVGTIEEGGHD